MIINNYDLIKKDAVEVLKDDYTELWFLVAMIEEENPHFTFSEMIEATKQLVSFLNSSNDLLLVDPETESVLKTTNEKIQELIQNLFGKINRLPNIGDGIWLSIER